MVQYFPENTWDHVDLLNSTRYQQRHLHAKHWSTSRRQAISKPHYRQQPSTSSPPFPTSLQDQQDTWLYYLEDEHDLYEPPLSYLESHETMPDDLLLNNDDVDDYNDYMNAVPHGPRWSSSFSTRLHPPPPPQRRRSLASQYQPDYTYDYDYYGWNDYNDYDYDDDDEKYLANDDEQVRPKRRTSKNYHPIDSRLRRHRSLGRPSPQRSTYRNYSDNEEDDIIYSHHQSNRHQQQQQNYDTGRQYHHQQQRRTSIATPWINSPQVMGSPESIITSPVLRHTRMEQGPPPPPPTTTTLLSIDTQQPQIHLPNTTAPFYGQVLPMPQPMIPPLPPVPSSFLPYYAFPTMPAPPLPPFNPMMIPQQPHHLLEKTPQPLPSVSTPTMPTNAPPRPSSDDAKSPSSAPDLTTTNNTNTSPVNSTNMSKGENALVPLARSLSLGTSQPLRVKPRRRSLFGSLFGYPSSTTPTNQQQQQPSSVTSSPSLIPVQDLTRDSLTRKQSLSLEKKAKALSQRSYIWCYRIKPSLTHQHVDPGWMAMAPRNQTKLDPYLVFYQPGAVVKGLIRTEALPTLVTLEKEPKLSGSITVMPQAKIARVYPSMFSSSNYMELVIDCLPADSQFVVRSD